MKPVLTVSEVTYVIKNIFESSDILRQVFIRGEISNFKHHVSGHMYFTLKDEKSQIRCVMFRRNNRLLPFLPENGMKVIVFGFVSVFPKMGSYQLYAEDIEPDGIGALHLAFEKLKAGLEKEGLFDVDKKLPIPYLPKKIGVITSMTGAAIKDILTVIKRRFPNVDIIIAPVLVQGKGAAEEISEALEDLNKFSDIDAIILGRGGGSIEELWAFNEEKVARAISNSNIPVISAVGHETDYTISDFVSDHRAPTPSAAGEIVVPEKKNLKMEIRHLNSRLVNALQSSINVRRQKLEYIKRSAVYMRPNELMVNSKLYLDEILKSLQKGINSHISYHKMNLKHEMSKLDALSPLNILKRGYSLCTYIDNNDIIRSVRDINNGDQFKAVFSDGSLICSVQKREEKGDLPWI